MENDKDRLDEIFKSFDPDLSSDYLFMQKLMKNMRSVEIIKENNYRLRRHNKMAACISGVTGFITGVVFTLFLPYIRNFFAEINPEILFLNNYNFTNILDRDVVAWIVVSATSILAALGSYGFVISRLKLTK